MVFSGKWIEGLGPDTIVADAARRSLEPRLAAVAHALPLAAHLAEHDIEHVHRLRVATRRAAAALKLYHDLLPRKLSRWFKKRLRYIRRAAGESRDLDVLILRLQRDAGTKAEPFVHFLEAKRSAVQPNIIELAEEMRHDDRFVRKAARLFSRISQADRADDSATSIRFGDWALQEFNNFRSRFIELLPNESDDIDALHQFRIRTKALRYAIELLAPAFGPDLRKEIYPAVENLQERLGKITDHIAAIRLMAEWETHCESKSLRESSGYLDLEKAMELENLRRFREWWQPKRSEWLEWSTEDPSHIVRAKPA